ncbi:MAG: hypothetical protein AUK12_05345 [Candidatus Levybacteria bacterium CG2_30_37_29]|nr:MAG: hypothetical protein AUK12_05345 [Candidatus Levybacteria bacterium CG2_30_37_29]
MGKKKRSNLQWKEDLFLKKQLNSLVKLLEFAHIPHKQVFCYRTTGSTARAYARIWAFPKIFQEVLQVPPTYVIEVLSEKFDRLNDEQKVKVLIHELLHIPKNFSGSLLPHRYGGKRIDKEVDRLYRMMKSK